MIDTGIGLAVMNQCALINLAKATYYRKKEEANPESEHAQKLRIKVEKDREVIEEIVQIFSLDPSKGTRKMTADLQRAGYVINRKRVKRLMRAKNLMSCAPGPHTSTPRKENKIYPYLLRNALIEAPDDVWSTDITYVRVGGSFMYVTAIIDWFSRYIISWDVSNTLDVEAPIRALDTAFQTERKPLIFNMDQGSQFTSENFTGKILGQGVYVSMDSKGRAIDNIYLERFWRSLKYEWLHLWDFEDGHQLHHGVNNYVERYNHKRLHQSLNYATPAEVYLDGVSAPEVSIKWKYQKELKSVEVICEELNLVITKKEEVLNAEVE
jgi:putative transposase